MGKIDGKYKAEIDRSHRWPVLILAAFVVVFFVLILAGCGAQQCGADQISHEDYGCIDKDDLDLNNSGSTDDEEEEWDDD